MTISPVKGVRGGAPEAKGVGNLGRQVAVWGLLEGSPPPAADWLYGMWTTQLCPDPSIDQTGEE